MEWHSTDRKRCLFFSLTSQPTIFCQSFRDGVVACCISSSFTQRHNHVPNEFDTQTFDDLPRPLRSPDIDLYLLQVIETYVLLVESKVMDADSVQSRLKFPMTYVDMKESILERNLTVVRYVENRAQRREI